MKKIFVLIIVLVVIIIAVILGFKFYFKEAPLPDSSFNFSYQIRTSLDDINPSKIGLVVDEENMKVYDKFYYPASFAVNEDNNRLFILDSIKKRILIHGRSVFDDVPLKSSLNPKDIIWDKYRNSVIVNYQSSSVITMMSLGFSTDPAGIHVIKTTDVDLADLFKNNFLANDKHLDLVAYNAKDNKLVLNTEEKGKEVLIVNLDEKVGSTTIALADSFNAKAYGGFGKIATQSTISEDLVNIFDNQGALLSTTSISVIKDTLKDDSLLFSKLEGIDDSLNLYVSAYFGSSYDQVSSAKLYKIKDGVIINSFTIPVSPKMLVYRYLFISQKGRVFYALRDVDKNVINYKEIKVDNDLL